MKIEQKKVDKQQRSRGVFQEDIEAAVECAEALLGKQGRMLENPGVYDAKVGTPALGIIWYGDVDEDDNEKIDALEKALGVTLQVTVGSGFGS